MTFRLLHIQMTAGDSERVIGQMHGVFVRVGRWSVLWIYAPRPARSLQVFRVRE